MKTQTYPVTPALLARYVTRHCQAREDTHHVKAIVDELGGYAPAEVRAVAGIYYGPRFEALDAALDPVIDVDALVDSHAYSGSDLGER